MLGLRIESTLNLSEILRPLRGILDSAWWYLNGHGVRLENLIDIDPTIAPPAALKTGSEAEVAEWLRANREWLTACDQQMSRIHAEYAQWMDDSAGYRVGLPGWFSRYVDLADTCWAEYVACECPGSERPKSALNEIHETSSVWQNDMHRFLFPQEAIFACRNVDDAFWEFAFRDEDDFNAIQMHLEETPEADSTPLEP